MEYRGNNGSGNGYDGEPGLPDLRPYSGSRELILASNGASREREESSFHLWDYIRILSRRRWTAAAVFTVCVLSTLVLSLAATSVYRSTALLQIQPGGPKITDFDSVQESVTQSQAYADFFQTQYIVLTSRALARRTIDELGLEENPYINGEFRRSTMVGRGKSWVGAMLSEGGDEARLAARREHEMVDDFIESVSVRPRRKSFLVELSFSSPDPALARDVTETLAREYIDLTLDQRIEAASQARHFIEKQLDKVKGKLEASEQALQVFAKGQEIHAIEQEERVIQDRLTDLNDRLTEAEASRIAAETTHVEAISKDRRYLSQIVNSPLIKSLREELAKVQADRAELGATFTDEFPEVRTLDARIEQLEDAIFEAEDRILSSVRSEYEQAVEREVLLREKLEMQKAVVAAYEEKAIDFKILHREVSTNREIYEDLLRRMKEVEVAEAIRATNISLLDPPEEPLEAASPNLPLNLALSMLIGAFGGIGFAFFQEYMDDSLKTPDDVERHLALPTLGAVPEFSLVRINGGEARTSADLEVACQPTSAGAEAIRTLRASLLLAAPGGLPSRLLLTSAQPGEGKTCIAVNLATALAQTGRKVCLVDCDLRRPRVHKALGMNLSPGLSNYLTGNLPIDDIIRRSGQSGLDFVSAGPLPPNPVDLLNSAPMQSLLRDLEERYDQVLVDAPPALGFADVPIMASQLGGACLLVARSGETSKRMARQACDYLIRMQSKLLGVVLNRVSTGRDGHSYYGYYTSYGDYYGQRGNEEETQGLERVA